MVELKVLFCRDPIPVPDKDRKPLTEVQEFNLHVDHRAVDRAEFDKKVIFLSHFLAHLNLFTFSLLVWILKQRIVAQIKEKEMIYKRYREEAESARMVCYTCSMLQTFYYAVI